MEQRVSDLSGLPGQDGGAGGRRVGAAAVLKGGGGDVFSQAEGGRAAAGRRRAVRGTGSPSGQRRGEPGADGEPVEQRVSGAGDAAPAADGDAADKAQRHDGEGRIVLGGRYGAVCERRKNGVGADGQPEAAGEHGGVSADLSGQEVHQYPGSDGLRKHGERAGHHGRGDVHPVRRDWGEPGQLRGGHRGAPGTPDGGSVAGHGATGERDAAV